MHRIALDSFSVAALPGWQDITASVDADSPPVTLARDDGVGALQFSLALYASGPIPNPTPTDLLEMVAAFAESRGLGAPGQVVVESGPLLLAASAFAYGEDFLRIWQVSDGRNFAFVTYACEWGQQGGELEECEQIVRSLQFA